MNTVLKYSVSNLLIEDKEGNISGPMSPVLFAKEMAKQMEFKYNRLARLRLDDEKINQNYEGDVFGLTAHDTLIIGMQSKNDLWLSIWVDMGVNGLPVAMGYQSDKEIVLTPIYQKTVFAEKLTIERIREVFDYIYANPQSIAIQKKSN